MQSKKGQKYFKPTLSEKQVHTFTLKVLRSEFIHGFHL